MNKKILFLISGLVLILIIGYFTGYLPPSNTNQSLTNSPGYFPPSRSNSSDQALIDKYNETLGNRVEGDFFVSEALGIKFKLTDELKQQKLIFGEKQNNRNEKSVAFSTQALNNLSNECDVKYGPLGTIIRYEGVKPENSGISFSSGVVKQMDGFYLYIYHPDQFCRYKDWTGLSRLDEQINTLIKDISYGHFDQIVFSSVQPL